MYGVDALHPSVFEILLLGILRYEGLQISAPLGLKGFEKCLGVLLVDGAEGLGTHLAVLGQLLAELRVQQMLQAFYHLAGGGMDRIIEYGARDAFIFEAVEFLFLPQGTVHGDGLAFGHVGHVVRLAVFRIDGIAVVLEKRCRDAVFRDASPVVFKAGEFALPFQGEAYGAVEAGERCKNQNPQGNELQCGNGCQSLVADISEQGPCLFLYVMVCGPL